MNLIASTEAYLNTPGNAASPRRFYLDEPIPEVVWPDPRDPRRTSPAFEECGMDWLLERVMGQRRDKQRVPRAAFFRLGRDEELPDGREAERQNLPLTRETVREWPYISLLESSYQAIVRVDVDEPERIEDLKDLGMPPNLLGLNDGDDPSHRGRFQAWWILDVPVSMANGKAVALLRSVQAMLRAATGADKSGTSDVNRNPWYVKGSYSWHLLHQRAWTLDEMKDLLVDYLADALHLDDLLEADTEPVGVQHGDDGSHVAGSYMGPRVLSSAQREAQREGRHVGEGHFRPWRVRPDGSLLRNCALFMQVSEVARKARIRDGIVDERQLLEVLHELNGLIEEDWQRDGLDARELAGLAKKVARYWTRHFDPNWNGRCAFYTEEGRRLGTETMKAQGQETRRKVIELLRSRLTIREISERIDRGVRRVQQIVKALRNEATQMGISLEDLLLDLTSRATPTPEPRNSLFAPRPSSSSDRPSESPHMSLSASTSSTSVPEKPSRRRSRRRRGPARLL